MKIYFCEKCGVSIPLQEVVGGRATARDGKTYCQSCNPEIPRDGDDLKLYFCDNCRVSIPLQDVITSRAKMEGDSTLCSDCSRLTTTQRSARRERIERDMREREESRYRLHFCDSCNTSIPQSHLVTGRSIVRGGRTFCERCKGRAERRKVSALTTVMGILILGLVFVGGYVLLGPGRSLFAGPPPAGAAEKADSALKAEIEEAVRASLADERKAVDQRFSDLSKMVKDLAGASGMLKDEFEEMTVMARQADSDNAALRTEMERRLTLAESSFREAIEKLAVLSDRIDEMKTRPAAATPAAGNGGPVAGPDVIVPRVRPEPGADEPEPEPEPAVEPAPPQVQKWIDDLSSKDAGVRFSAAVELGKTGYKPASVALAKVLEGDSDMFVRRAAARSLGDLDSWKSIPALIETLQDRDYFVAVTAHKALEKITGQDFGFTENMNRTAIRKVVQKANRWWEEHQEDRAD